MQIDASYELAYTGEPTDWIKYLGPVGATKEFVLHDGSPEVRHGDWIAPEEKVTWMRIAHGQGGSAGPLKWYKSCMRGINGVDEAG